MIIGAILTQNTNWNNVEKALSNLRDNHRLSFPEIIKTPILQLEQMIKPSGYFRQKSRRLQALATNVVSVGGLDSLEQLTTSQLKAWLLSQSGIGPETADSILLYAFKRPVFVIDAYTLRVGKRHNWLDDQADYRQAQDFFTRNLPLKVDVFNEFHALLVQLGKNYCRTKKPLCQGCPIVQFLNY
jgi:endonuclease-3 related protein